ncbi:hypothetical protein BDN71DRAFT_1430681 [Pleurotus eryngii]|uniref:Uncharacterized protein n=1 Tax=Pleurotus eryngii TaxID=5323 RepID=A0A9P6DGD4_PLEER|nr:hypothetical protein BDN71DRAFT_1430681 [Pleurotus eryngii]
MERESDSIALSLGPFEQRCYGTNSHQNVVIQLRSKPFTCEIAKFYGNSLPPHGVHTQVRSSCKQAGIKISKGFCTYASCVRANNEVSHWTVPNDPRSPEDKIFRQIDIKVKLAADGDKSGRARAYTHMCPASDRSLKECSLLRKHLVGPEDRANDITVEQRKPWLEVTLREPPTGTSTRCHMCALADPSVNVKTRTVTLPRGCGVDTSDGLSEEIVTGRGGGGGGGRKPLHYPIREEARGNHFPTGSTGLSRLAEVQIRSPSSLEVS